MFSKLALINAYRKVITFLKEYKFFIFFFLVIALFFGWRFWQLHNQINSMTEGSQALMLQTNNSIAEIRSEYTQQIAEQQVINERQTEELTRLTNEYTQRLNVLEARTRTRRATFVSETNGNPQAMADRLTKRLGWRTQ